jgi:hypothetical protein
MAQRAKTALRKMINIDLPAHQQKVDFEGAKSALRSFRSAQL